MEMQGWPLFAAGVGTGRVFAVVGWERGGHARDAEHPHAMGVELNEDVAKVPYTAHPYAVDLTTELEGADVVVGSDERAMWFAAGPRDDDAVRLLDYALHLRMYGENAPGGTETWAEFDRRCEAHLRRIKGLDMTTQGPTR